MEAGPLHHISTYMCSSSALLPRKPSSLLYLRSQSRITRRIRIPEFDPRLMKAGGPKHRPRAMTSNSGKDSERVATELKGTSESEERIEEEEDDEKGLVEDVESLEEEEAIMGGDEGREPTDYHRRAQIFDKRSRVFQALNKDHSS